MTLLANGQATTYEGPVVKKTLGQLPRLPRLTACMVSITATLGAFSELGAVEAIFKQLLLDLLDQRRTERNS
jgi:hypothetical protein